MTDMSQPPNSPIGQSLRRREDVRFLTGAGQYTDDVVLPGQTYGFFLRSPYAHARIKSINARRGQGRAGRAAHLHRRRPGRSQGRRAALRLAHHQQGRHADEGAARTRCWRKARCATSATRWRWWWPRPTCRRATPPN